MRIFSSNLFSAIKSHEKKSTQAIVTIKNTLAHKLVTCNGIFINSICTIRNHVDSTHNARQPNAHTDIYRIHFRTHTKKDVYCSANWLGDYFAWAIRVKHPNNFMVHGYLKSSTFTPCLFFLHLFLVLVFVFVHCVSLLLCVVWVGFWRPLKWHLKRIWIRLWGSKMW